MVFLSKEIVETLVDHARAVFPNEACGMLALLQGRAVKIYPGSNRDASPIHYQLDPVEQFHIFQEIEEKGWKIGIYHSHTQAKAKPSREDVERAYYPEALYFIISLRNWDDPELRSFWICEGKVKEEEIVLEGM